jgi:superfamily II DNA or RNA helicase
LPGRTTRGRPVLEAPSPHNWRSTDDEEIDRRRWRAQTESFSITNTDPRHPIFSNFRVRSSSGLVYCVEIRSLSERQFACQCVDFRINGLGTCKHVEAVLGLLEARFRKLWPGAIKDGSPRLEVVLDASADTLRLQRGLRRPPASLKPWFDADGGLREASPEDAVAALRELAKGDQPGLRLSQEIDGWLESRQRAAERARLRREYEQKVQSGEWPASETKAQLFPYQRTGMLHLAFAERALLADEMGLGKTIQAIAACALLQRLGAAGRALVVTPASLKTEWEEQIQRFTDLSYQLVYGPRYARLKAYDTAGPAKGEAAAAGPFFTIVNYEQMLADSLEVNARLRPDIVILDEAQRIKNWSTRTTQAVKRLRSRYAFVLTGTPIENRIDELHSLMDFLDPTVLGPLFRFNREYYELDERGRPAGYRNLARLHEQIRPLLLRRRKADVETELPERTDRNFFVALQPAQALAYQGYAEVVAKLASLAKRRPLTQPEQEKMLRFLNMMRMTCDTNFILDPEDRTCTKLTELERILEECRDNAGVKVIVFSEWERMLQLVRELAVRLGLGFAWHTGTVPQRRRRAEINAFKTDPDCRLFLSTDSGATGLNLQAATVVINCDLPWNPAKLEQRIARAWRKHQTRPVTVINLVAENTIEHRMLETLAHKQALSDGVLDLKGDLNEIKIRTGRQAFFSKLEQLLAPGKARTAADGQATPPKPPLPADRALGFAQAASRQINGALVRCEERYPASGPHSVVFVVVDRDAAQWQPRLTELHEEYFKDTDPLAPVRLEVIDRATDEALRRLTEAGLLATTVRAARPLFPESDGTTTPVGLSEEERTRAGASRTQAARKLKMARMLETGGFGDEARAAMREAAQACACALAVEHRLSEPASLADAVRGPLTPAWREALPELRAFLLQDTHPWAPLADQLEKL